MLRGHDATWWATWIGLSIAVLMMILSLPPGNLVVKAFTNMFQDWLAARTKASLEKRIAKLENELREVEEVTPITEAELHILWGITSIRLTVMGIANILVSAIYFAVTVIADPNTSRFKDFTGFILYFFFINSFMMFRQRYRRDFRYFHDPRRKPALIKSIEELKKIRDKWQ